MGLPLRLLLPLVGSLAAFIVPKLLLIGTWRTVEPYAGAACRSVPLEACEDVWVSHERNFALLPCASKVSRAHWTPAVLHLEAASLPPLSRDFIASIDLDTGAHQKLEIRGALPAGWTGIYVHALDAFHLGGDKYQIAINSHRPPQDRFAAPEIGADSVIELFDYSEGDGHVTYRKTVAHDLVRTPNNVVLLGKDRFFFTNDHARKVHWSRKFEALWPEGSDVIYCDASGATPDCKVAASGLTYPNGITKGPGNTVYVASTIGGYITHFSYSPETHELTALSRTDVSRLIDNIIVTPAGELYAATLPVLAPFSEGSTLKGHEKNTRAPAEVWRLRNATNPTDLKKFDVDRVFHDNGSLLSGLTSVGWSQGALVLTGLFTDDVKICPL